MPIYEFSCLDCRELFETIVMNTDECDTVKCPKCDSTAVERVMSTTNYSMTGGGSNAVSVPSARTRTCDTGSCTTYDIPGPR